MPTQRNGKLCSRDLKADVLEDLYLRSTQHSCCVYFYSICTVKIDCITFYELTNWFVKRNTGSKLIN